MPEAVQMLDSLLAVDQGNIGGYAWRGIAKLVLQDYESAIADIQHAGLHGLGAGAQNQYGLLYRMAQAYLALNRPDEAFALLGLVVEAGLHSRERLMGDAALTSLHADTRFSALLDKADRIQALNLHAVALDSLVLDQTHQLHEEVWAHYPEYDLTSVTHVSAPHISQAEGTRPLLIWLNPELPTERTLIALGIATWRNVLPNEWIIATPANYNLSNIDFPKWGWDTAEGLAVVNEVTDYLTQHYPVDPQRIVLGGFMSGADIVWHYAQAEPDRYAGLLSFGGNPARMDRQRFNNHIVNYRNTQVKAILGRVGHVNVDDLAPYRETTAAEAPSVSWTVIDGAADYDALHRLGPHLAKWLSSLRLDPHPDRIEWQVGEVFPRYPATFWLQVDALTDDRMPNTFAPLQLQPRPFEVTDWQWTWMPIAERLGKGLNVVRIFEEGPLHKAGIRRGDFLQEIDGRPIKTAAASTAISYLYAEGTHTEVPLVYEHDGIQSRTMLPLTIAPTLAFYNSDTSHRIEVEKRGNDVYVRADGIAQFSLLIHPDHFNVEQGISVYVNGERRIDNMIVPVRTAVSFGGIMHKNTGLLRVSSQPQ
ncbi:MAG: hypothetical protein RhofKO_09000 [Rhodothermales bacterium]